MKNHLALIVLLVSVGMVGIFVALCGIGLSMGFRKLSLLGFFGALVLLIILRLSEYFTRKR